MPDSSQFRNAINDSVRLLDADGLPAALRPLDAAIAEAVRQNSSDWIKVLSAHAAVLCQVSGNLPLRRHYYELLLRHDPNSFMALYGLASVCLDEGQTDQARCHAKQCYAAVVASDDPLAPSMLDMIQKHWPDIVRPTER